MRHFHDSAEHRRLVQRTLRVTESQWTQVIEQFCSSANVESSLAERLQLVQQAFSHVIKPAALPAIRTACPMCQGPVASTCSDESLTMGRCASCGHGVLLHGAAAPTIYGPDYYQVKSADGAGYEGYLEERVYREAKGERIMKRLVARHGHAPKSLLEVGSGYGFTRRAAEHLRLRTAGVDLNPLAAQRSQALYGFPTLTGSARDVTGSFDLVLYQFVLEHIADVQSEVAESFRLCAPGGLVCFIVPSMDTVECTLFHSRYRSFRSDHLHVFSRRSITHLLETAGFTSVVIETECQLHLLAGFLEADELQSLYTRGEGPDLFVTARRP